MLSLCELRRVAEHLRAEFVGRRIERIVQPSPLELVISLYGRGRENAESSLRHLLLSCDPELGRVAELPRVPRAPQTPPAFASFLRARLGNARLTEVELLGDDRQLALRTTAGSEGCDLLLALHGRRSNLYALDRSGQLARALRPLAETRPELVAGEPWRPPDSAPPAPGEDRWPQVPDTTYLREIESRYSERDRERGSQALERRLSVALRKEHRRAQNRQLKLERELAEADQVGALHRQGELLKGALGRVRTGDTEVRTRDYETDEEVVIPLDPARSPAQNLEATFKRYHKLLRRLTQAGSQVDVARERCIAIEALQSELTAAPAEPDARLEFLGVLADRPEVAALLARYAPAQKRRGPSPKQSDTARIGRFAEVPRRLHPRRYESLDGLEIWVGRNDEANDFLTTRLAHGNDLFFHLDGAPGSHVVLRTQGLSDVPQESLLDACELAVHFSRAHHASRAEVHISPIKRVKKPKGAKPGLVWVTGGRSLHLRREDTRLQRLLAARLDR